MYRGRPSGRTLVVDKTNRHAGRQGPPDHVGGASTEAGVIVEGHHQVRAPLPEHLLIPDGPCGPPMADPVGGKDPHDNPKTLCRDTGERVCATCAPVENLSGRELAQDRLHEG